MALARRFFLVCQGAWWEAGKKPLTKPPSSLGSKVPMFMDTCDFPASWLHGKTGLTVLTNWRLDNWTLFSSADYVCIVLVGKRSRGQRTHDGGHYSETPPHLHVSRDEHVCWPSGHVGRPGRLLLSPCESPETLEGRA